MPSPHNAQSCYGSGVIKSSGASGRLKNISILDLLVILKWLRKNALFNIFSKCAQNNMIEPFSNKSTWSKQKLSRLKQELEESQNQSPGGVL